MASDEIDPERDSNGNPIWSVDGYRGLFDGEYHDWQNEDWKIHGDNWLPEADYVVISWADAKTGELQHATLEGPFEDIPELDDVVDTYFEEGSP